MSYALTGERRAYNIKWHAANRAKNNARSREYHRTHKAEISESSRAWRVLNAEKIRINDRAKYRRNPDKVRRSHMKMYGLTIERYEQMLEAQSGVCALCGRTNKNGYRLAVDHDHETGRVRGLLCTNCNNGLGRFKDNPGLLRKAADYITEHKGDKHD